MSVVVEHVDDDEIFGVCGPVVIRVVDGGPTEVAHIDRTRELTEAVLERSPVAGIWIVVHHGTPPPSVAVARHTKHSLQAFIGRVPVVYTMLGIGFWAATARTAATLFNRALGMPSPLEATVEAGAQRMALELVGVNPDELVAAFESLSAQLAAHRELSKAS